MVGGVSTVHNLANSVPHRIFVVRLAESLVFQMIFGSRGLGSTCFLQ